MDVDGKRSSSSSSSSPPSSVTRSPGGAADTSKSSGTGSCSVVAAGSVWETRMKNDEVRGGIKVFDGGETEGDNLSNAEVGGDGERLPSCMSNSPTPKGAANKKTGQSINRDGGGKRKTWRSDQGSADGPVSPQVSRSSPGVQAKKGKMEVNPRSPIQGRKLRSDTARGLPELRKLKSDSGKGKVSDGAGGNCSSTASGSAQLREANSEPLNFVDEASESVGATTEKGAAESGSDGISEDKLVTSISDQNPELARIQSSRTSDDDEAEDYSEDEEEDEISDEEIEEKSCEDTKEINMALEPNQKNVVAATVVDKPKPVSGIVDKQPQVNEKPKPVDVPTIVDRQPPPSRSPPPETITKHTTTRTTSRVNRNIASPTTSKLVSSNTRRKFDINRNYAKPTSYEYESFPEAHSKLQNLVDLVMWRDVSRTAFVFGIGAFTIISSSYTRDLNVSFITVISYLGLVYLATIFLYRSLIFRGYIDDVQSRGNVLREDEAIWLLKLVLPYLNELLVKLKSLFSGDPATTMKLAVLLFVMSRCGSSITIGKMAKLGFFGAFTVPKVCSSYSAQIYAQGNFWVQRFRDAWESCSHKKVVAFGIFTLVWNLSSVVARIWAAFMLFAAFRYYQQSMMARPPHDNDDCAKDYVGIVEPSKERRAS